MINMSKAQVYYVSLDDKKVSDQPIQGEATLEVVATPEEVEKIKGFMHKDEDGVVGERYEEDLKTLFQLMYKLGTEETRKSLDKMLK